MTAMTLYQASIPPMRRSLANLAAFFAKSADHFAAQGVPESDWLGASLAPDMFTLTRQIQLACDAAKFAAARLSASSALVMEDVETSVAELSDRIARTIAYLDDVAPSAIDGREDAEIEVNFPNASIYFTGSSYLRDFGMPNLFFHVTTAYAIMRHKGAPIGKMDFLGPIEFVPHDAVPA